MATVIAVYANWEFARIHGIGWGWAGVIWIYSLITYIPLDALKFIIRYTLSGKAWDTLLQNKVHLLFIYLFFFYMTVFIHTNIYVSFLFFFWFSMFIVCMFCYKIKTAFTTKKDYGRGEREAQWAMAQRTLHGLQSPRAIFNDKNNHESTDIAEQAKRRAEVAR